MPYDNNLEFRPGTVVPLPNTGWTFTVRDQFDRTWNAFENMGATFAYTSAALAKSAMRRFCGIGDIN